ncbi:hypothetical protein V8F20_004578 [Naviculisporaceae sp. PSN 640]
MLNRNSTLLSSPKPDLSPAAVGAAHAQQQQQQHPPSTLALRAQNPDGHVAPRELEKQHRQVQQLAFEEGVVSTPTPPVRAKLQTHHRASNSLSTPPSLSSLSPLQEYHSGYSDVEAGSSPFPSSKQHRRQQSFPNLLPLALRSKTPSPTRKLSFLPDQMPFTGDGRGGTKAVDNPRGGFAGWFSSSPVVPSSASSRGTTVIENTGVPSTADNTPTRLRRSTSSATVTTTAASRFMSAISSRFNPGSSNTSSMPLEDELCDLDIETVLFPPTSPLADRDSFSPAAFKNFQTNAIGLLNRFQNAYREQTITVREMQAEKSAQNEEMEEAETRAQHLKMQLEGMARKAQEQETVMRQLMEELAAERKARANEQRRFAALMTAGDKSPVVMSEGGSMVSEDLGVDEDRLRLRLQKKDWRKSSGSMMSSAGGTNPLTDDTDEESAESESVFSRCRSPPLLSPLGNEIYNGSSTYGNGNGTGTLIEHARNASSLAIPSSTKQQQPQQQQKSGVSAFQKIIRGISGTESDEGSGGVTVVTECQNCQGQDASVAWDTVSLLRDENRHLKSRVGQLEVVVEGALDLVNGIGL